MVTRTIKGVKYTALCIDLVTQEAYNESGFVSGTFKNEAKLEKAVKALIESEKVKVVAITDYEKKSFFYAMNDEAFIAGAEKYESREEYNKAKGENE